MEQDELAQLKSVKEASDILGLTEGTIRVYINRLKIKAVKVGGRHVRIHQDEINRILKIMTQVEKKTIQRFDNSVQSIPPSNVDNIV